MALLLMHRHLVLSAAKRSVAINVQLQNDVLVLLSSVQIDFGQGKSEAVEVGQIYSYLGLVLVRIIPSM